MSDFDEIVRKAQQMRAAAPPAPAPPPDDFDLIAKGALSNLPTAPPDATPAPTPALERAGRLVGNFGAGANESIANTIGAVPDLYNRLLASAGIPHLPPGTYRDSILKAINSVVGQPPTPEGLGERVARGAGRGVADAASVFMPAAGVANAARAGSVTQGVGSALASQPVAQAVAGGVGGTVGEATGSPLAGTAAAMATPLAGAALGRVVSPTRPGPVSPELQRLAQVAQAEGIPLTPAQRTGSRALHNVEEAFASMPFTSGREGRRRDEAAQAFNRAVMGKAGIEGETRATPEVLNEARNRLGQQFTELSSRNSLNADQTLVADMTRHLDTARRYLPADIRGPVVNRVEDALRVMTQNGGAMPGHAYREMDSALGRQMRTTSNGDLRSALGEVRDTLRSAMDRNISPEDSASWHEVRREYANLMNVARTMDRPSAQSAAGNISPAGLGQSLRQGLGGGQGYAFGRGDMNDLARVGQAFLKPQIPNSGTTERAIMARILTGAPISTGAGAAAMGADPGIALGAGAIGTAALALPRAAQAAYYSRLGQGYMGNQLAAGVAPEMDRALIAALLAERLRAGGTEAVGLPR